MDPVVVIAAAAALVVVLGVSLMLWRLWRGNEELQAGGSMSRQMFGRTKDE